MVRNKDKNFVNSLSEEIYTQQEINDSDFILTVTKDQIRNNTNRKTVRGVILDEYAEAFETMPGVEATVRGNKVVINAKSEVNQVFQDKYNSLEELRNSNKSRLKDTDD